MAVYREGSIHYAQPAGADLTGKLYCFAAVDSSGNIVTAGSGGNVIGTIVEEATLGNAASVQCNGIAKVKTGGNIAAGSRVQSDANGLALSLQSGVAAGIALNSAISGDIISVRLY